MGVALYHCGGALLDKHFILTTSHTQSEDRQESVISVDAKQQRKSINYITEIAKLYASYHRDNNTLPSVNDFRNLHQRKQNGHMTK